MPTVFQGAVGVATVVGSVFTLYFISKKTIKEKINNYVECPTRFTQNAVSVFLGGGIANCPDWRSEIIPLIHAKSPDLVLFNPRRKKFDVSDKSVSSEQIVWEHDHLHMSDAILFWFCAETMNPITLYELGAWSTHPSHKPLFIGCHPDYQRKIDVSIQTQLCRPELSVVYSLEELAQQVNEWYAKQRK